MTRIMICLETPDSSDYPDWYSTLSNTLAALTDDGERRPGLMSVWLNWEGNQELGRFYVGMRAETAISETPRVVIWPLGQAESFEPKFREMVDIADVPGHPPVHVPGDDNPLPEHVMHKVTECDFCAHLLPPAVVH